MEIAILVDKIHSLERQERRLPREDLIGHRRELMSWYSRLAQEIPASRLRRLNEIEILLPRQVDSEQRWKLIRERQRLMREIAIINIEAEMNKLLSG